MSGIGEEELLIAGLGVEASRRVTGPRLRDLRLARGMSQEEFAGDDCAQSLLSKIERGKSGLTKKLVAAFAFRLGLNLEDLEEVLLQPEEGSELSEEASRAQAVSTVGDSGDPTGTPDSQESTPEPAVTDQDAGDGPLFQKPCSNCQFPSVSATHQTRDGRWVCDYCFQMWWAGKPNPPEIYQLSSVDTLRHRRSVAAKRVRDAPRDLEVAQQELAKAEQLEDPALLKDAKEGVRKAEHEIDLAAEEWRLVEAKWKLAHPTINLDLTVEVAPASEPSTDSPTTR